MLRLIEASKVARRGERRPMACSRSTIREVRNVHRSIPKAITAASSSTATATCHGRSDVTLPRLGRGRVTVTALSAAESFTRR